MKRNYFRLVDLLLHSLLNRKYICLIILFYIISPVTNGAAFGPDSSTIAPTQSENSTVATSNETQSTNNEQAVNQPFTCQNLTNSAQRNMCYRTPGLLKAIIKAEQLAKKECIEQFRYERWNCSGFAMTTPSNVTKHATAEAAYMYAIMSAALAQVVTEDCRSNGMNCSCGKNATLPNEESDTAVKHGCSDNIPFGLDMAAKFMDGKEKHGRIGNRQRVNLQNILVGRTVFHNVNKGRVHCKCIGYSASCPVKVCRVKIGPFNVVAAQLKEHYKKSCKVSVKNNGFKSHCQVPSITNETLIHAVSSPDFCHINLAKGSAGVSGRECELASGDEKDCNRLCCGRGHYEYKETVSGKCCDYHLFVWRCTDCKRTRINYICR